MSFDKNVTKSQNSCKNLNNFHQQQYPVILGKSRTFGYYCVNAERFEVNTLSCRAHCEQYIWYIMQLYLLIDLNAENAIKHRYGYPFTPCHVFSLEKRGENTDMGYLFRFFITGQAEKKTMGRIIYQIQVSWKINSANHVSREYPCMTLSNVGYIITLLF